MLWGTDVDGKTILQGMIVAHVDDLLFCGNVVAEKSLQKIGVALGFGSESKNDFGVASAFAEHQMALSG